MKVILALALLAPTLGHELSPEANAYLASKHGEKEPLKSAWAQFKMDFAKKYASAEEEEKRFEFFAQSVERVVDRNEGLEEPVFGITKFSDLSADEFSRRYLSGLKRSGASSDNVPVVAAPTTAAPADFDWRAQGMTTAVKDQGYCGSCWAHSTVEAIESAWAIGGHDLTSFSVQQLTACDTSSDDAGCDGGDPPSAYAYIEDAGGLATEATYPYDKSTYAGTCSDCKSDITIAGGAISGYSYATKQCYGRCKNQNETYLQASVASYGAPSICVDASSWGDYTGGVMTSDSCSKKYGKLDHCVQLVGYNTSASTPYWIVRNSWASDWGEDGCIYLKFGDNTCGVADEATIPTLA